MCWKGRPAHCLANEQGFGNATAANLLSPASPASSLGPSIIPDRHMYLFFTLLHFSFPSRVLPPIKSLLNLPCNALLWWLQLHVNHVRVSRRSWGRGLGKAPPSRCLLPRGLLLRAKSMVPSASTPLYRERREELTIEYLLHAWLHQPLKSIISNSHSISERQNGPLLITGKETGKSRKDLTEGTD